MPQHKSNWLTSRGIQAAFFYDSHMSYLILYTNWQLNQSLALPRKKSGWSWGCPRGLSFFLYWPAQLLSKASCPQRRNVFETRLSNILRIRFVINTFWSISTLKLSRQLSINLPAWRRPNNFTHTKAGYIFCICIGTFLHNSLKLNTGIYCQWKTRSASIKPWHRSLALSVLHHAPAALAERRSQAALGVWGRHSIWCYW